MAGPGVMLSGSLRMLATKSVTETKNTFAALQEDSDSLDDSGSPELVETPQARSPGSSPFLASVPRHFSSVVLSRRAGGCAPVLEQGESRPVTERMRKDCKLECCNEPLEKLLKGAKSGEKQDDGTHVFQWKHFTTARQGAAECRPTSQRACEGVVGILDYSPDEFLQTKHLKTEINAAQ